LYVACEPVIGCETQVVGVNATGGGQLPTAPEEVPPDEELPLDDVLLEDEELLVEELVLPEEELLEELVEELVEEDELLASPPLEELLVDGSLLGDIFPPHAASNAALASNNVGGYLRCVLAARARHRRPAGLRVPLMKIVLVAVR
jgi:hypothetical protein